MCQYRYHYYSSCRHQTFTVFSLCANATLVTIPITRSQDSTDDAGESPSGPGQPQRDEPSPADGPPGDAQNPSRVSQTPTLQHQHQNMTATVSDTSVSKDASAYISGYDHSWIEHYPPPPRIRMRTQSQERPTLAEGYGIEGDEGCSNPKVNISRVNSLPSFLSTGGIRDQRQSRPAISPLGNFGQATGTGHGVDKASLTVLPTKSATNGARATEIHREGKGLEQQPGISNATSLTEVASRDSDVIVSLSWADMVGEEEEMASNLSATGSETWRYGNTLATATESKLTTTEKSPQLISGRNGGCSQTHVQENERLVEDSSEKLVNWSQGFQGGGAAGNDQLLEKGSLGGFVEHLEVKPGLPHRAYDRAQDKIGDLEPSSFAVPKTQEISSPEVTIDNQRGTALWDINASPRKLTRELRSRVTSCSLESSAVSQSSSSATEPFPSFDDSQFVEAESEVGGSVTDSDVGSFGSAMNDPLDEADDFQPLLPHEKLSSQNASQHYWNPPENRSPSAGEYPTTVNNSIDIGSVPWSRSRIGGTRGGCQCLSGHELFEVPTHILSVVKSSQSVRGDFPTKPRPNRGDSVRCERRSDRDWSHPAQEQYALLQSKMKRSPMFSKGNNQVLESQMISQARSWSKVHFNSAGTSARGGNQTVDMWKHQEKTDLRVGSGYAMGFATGAPKIVVTEGRRRKADTANRRYSTAGTGANSSNTSAQLALQAKTIKEIRQAPDPRDGVPEPTAMPIISANNCSLKGSLGRSPDYGPLVRLGTPGFDLSKMTFAERMQGLRSRELPLSAWVDTELGGPAKVGSGSMTPLPPPKPITTTETPRQPERASPLIAGRHPEPTEAKASGLKKKLDAQIERVNTAVAIPRIGFTRPSPQKTNPAKDAALKTVQGARMKKATVSESESVTEMTNSEKGEGYQQRSAAKTTISQPIASSSTLRSNKSTVTDSGTTSLKTYKLKVKSPEWSDLASSTSSLATFITAPESPILPWLPSQGCLDNQGHSTQPTSQDASDEEAYIHSATASDVSDHPIASSNEKGSTTITTMVESPDSVLTERTRDGKHLTAIGKIGGTQLSADFLLLLVSELSSESYKDIYQKHPTELESLLRLWPTSKWSRTMTQSSLEALVPQSNSSKDPSPITTAAHDKGYLADDSEHEAALSEARRGKRGTVAASQGTPDSCKMQENMGQEQTFVRRPTKDLCGSANGAVRIPEISELLTEGERLSLVPEFLKTQEPRVETEAFVRQLYELEQASNPKPPTLNQKYTVNGPEKDKDVFSNNVDATLDGPTAVDQGQIVSGIGGKKLNKKYTKKCNRYVAGEGSIPPTNSPISATEPPVTNEPPELAQEIGHIGLPAQNIYTAQVSSLQPNLIIDHPAPGATPSKSLATTGQVQVIEPYAGSFKGLHVNPVYYSRTRFSTLETPHYLPPVRIDQTFAPPPTLWMDYYGVMHSRKPAYPKCKWVGNEMIMLSKSERVLPPGWTDQVVLEPRHKRGQHSYPQVHSHGTFIEGVRKGDHMSGHALHPARRVSERSDRTQHSLPVALVGQELTPKQSVKPPRETTMTEKSLGGGDARAVSQESRQGGRTSGEGGLEIVAPAIGSTRLNTGMERFEVMRSMPYKPVEIVTGFVPCKKGEVTLAIEDFVQKCPKCDPDHQYEPNS